MIDDVNNQIFSSTSWASLIMENGEIFLILLHFRQIAFGVKIFQASPYILNFHSMIRFPGKEFWNDDIEGQNCANVENFYFRSKKKKEIEGKKSIHFSSSTYYNMLLVLLAQCTSWYYALSS